MRRTVTFATAVVLALWCAVCTLTAAAWATPLERVEFEGADQRLISGGLIRGDHIQGYLAKPEGAGPFPAVIGLHGCGGMPDTTKRKLVDELVGSGLPTLILIGALDDWTPAADCSNKIANWGNDGPPVELVVYPGAHHGFYYPHLQPGMTLFGHWLEYNGEAADDARRRLHRFLDRHLN